MNAENPYSTPRVDLFDEQPPRPIAGWSARQLRVLGYLHVLLFVSMLLQVGLGMLFTENTLWQSAIAWMGFAFTCLGSYLLLRTKQFVEVRFKARGLFWPVWLLIGLSVMVDLLACITSNSLFEAFTVFTLIYFGGLVLMGCCSLWFGICLVRLSDAYSSLRVTAWLEIIGGIMLASVVLLLIALFPLAAATLSIALMFFRAAKEVAGQPPT